MKKFIIFVLVFILTMTLLACGANEDKSLETTETNEEIASETIEADEEIASETIEVDEEIASETIEVDEEKLFTTIEATNCFYDAGFVELIAGVEEPSEYTFTAENSENVEWSVYVLDQTFDEGFRYIKQAAEPVLVADGTIFIDEGKYVYVYCSSNEFTTGVADEYAKLNVTIK